MRNASSDSLGVRGHRLGACAPAHGIFGVESSEFAVVQQFLTRREPFRLVHVDYGDSRDRTQGERQEIAYPI